LFKTTRDKETGVRQTAVYALGQVGLDNEDDLKALAQALKDAQPSVRALTVQALAQYSNDDVPAEFRAAALSHVAEAIKDRDRRAAWPAANILVSEKTHAVPGLVRLVETATGFPRILAAQVLGEIGEDAKDAVPALQKMSREGTADNRQAALLALQK